MASSRVKLNSRGIQEYLDGKHGVEAMLDRRINAAESTAKANAPVASGEYRDSLHVETDRTDRMVKRLVSDAPHAFVVEANTGNLSRALDAAGGS